MNINLWLILNIQGLLLIRIKLIKRLKLIIFSVRILNYFIISFIVCKIICFELIIRYRVSNLS